jgi:phosphatidylglycerol:prolipoprotein diacylglycerol transferase
VHPTQIYESLVGLSLFALMMLQRKHLKFRGQVFLLFTVAYGYLRYVLEILRDDGERGEYGPQLAEHLLIPGGLLLLALGYIFFVAQAVENKGLRVATQALVLAPVVALYVSLKPASFADQVLVRLSTSQWVALLTGVAAAIAYNTFWDAAKAHPERALDLGLPGEPPADAPADEENPAPKKRKKKKKAQAQAESPAEGEAAPPKETPPSEGEESEGLKPA